MVRSRSPDAQEQMPKSGVIFSDGVEADRPDCNSGTEAQIGVAERQGRLVV
jgi:hypothetical protein